MASNSKENSPDTDRVGTLSKQVAFLEKEKARLEEQLSTKGASALLQTNKYLLQQVADLESRLKKVERENRDFANLYVQAQEQNEAITNLYVASHRLHATLDSAEVMKMIEEILIELVGAEEYGILLHDEKKKLLELVAGEGASERLPANSLPAGEGIIGEVAATGQPFFFESRSEDKKDFRMPMAVIPLCIHRLSVGVIVIYKLLEQKNGFSFIDYQLLQLLASHAATALMSARLHATMDRRLRTMKGFVNLMKST